LALPNLLAPLPPALATLVLGDKPGSTMAAIEEAAEHMVEQYEEEFVSSATCFSFEVPVGVKAGVQMKVKAPDGVQLHIPMTASFRTGDKIIMNKNVETGKWGIKQVERPSISVEPNGQVTRRNAEQLQRDMEEPNVCTVSLNTSKGEIKLRIVPSWAPKGAQRFLQLVTDEYYSEVAIYRSVPNFLVQFGVISDQEKAAKYEPIQDDYIRGVPIQDGTVCFAAAGPNTRTATVCIFLGEYTQLGGNPWETPIGKVCPESMDTLHQIYTGYGDMPQCGGTGPDPIKLEAEGNDYITREFPLCDFIKSATWVMN